MLHSQDPPSDPLGFAKRDEWYQWRGAVDQRLTSIETTLEELKDDFKEALKDAVDRLEIAFSKGVDSQRIRTDKIEDRTTILEEEVHKLRRKMALAIATAAVGGALLGGIGERLFQWLTTVPK